MDGLKIFLVTLSHFFFAPEMLLLDLLECPIHVIALLGEDGVELVQSRGGTRNISNLFLERFKLLCDRVDLPLQARHSLFKGHNGCPSLTVFFVQPFQAFDELFKFHSFLQQGTYIELYLCAESAVLTSQMLKHERQIR